MKRHLMIALAACVGLAACNSRKNLTPGGFTVYGTINGMESGWVFFGHNDSMSFIRDSVAIKDHHFTFTGKAAGPSLYYLWIKEDQGMMVDPLNFFMDDTVMQMDVNKDSLSKTVVTGSPTEDLFIAYNDKLKPIKTQKDLMNKRYSVAEQEHNMQLMDSLEAAYEKVEAQAKDVLANYIHDNPGSVIGAWAVRRMLYDFDVNQIGKFYAEFSPAVQQSTYGKQIKSEYDIMERTAVGQMAPDFTMNDSTGKPVSLSSFHGKYVLLDFWASWCGPCRRENPNVVEAYNKFKDKNFTILGVSLDDNREAWLKAVNADGLTWNHVSDLKGWSNAAAAEYGIKAIPSNYLLDPSGKILAHNLRGEVLQDTLAKYCASK